MTREFKYGAHQFLWLEKWSDDSLWVLDEVRALGLGCFEISVGDDIRFAPAPVRKRAEALGLELTVGPGNTWPLECDISSDDPENRRRGMAWHRRTIERTAELGAVAYCGATYGHPGCVLRRPPPPDEMPRVAENLHHLAQYAGTLGVKLVIEPMSRFRTHLLHTAAQAVDMVRRTDHPNLLITLDTYHMVTEERSYGDALRKTAGRLWGIHACENDRGVPGGGLVPWGEVFTALTDTCPNSRILMETYNTGKDGFGFSRGIFQNLCPSATGFVSKGLEFLKQCATTAVRTGTKKGGS